MGQVGIGMSGWLGGRWRLDLFAAAAGVWNCVLDIFILMWYGMWATILRSVVPIHRQMIVWALIFYKATV